MSYIGKEPIIGNFVKLDAISVVNGQAAYTMQNGGANFIDYSSVNQFMVSLNSVIQSPGSSFTVSSSTITFASNLVTGDVIDFIIVFGNSLSSGTPTDATVSTVKIVDDAITAAKLNNTAITGQTAEATVANDDTVLIHDTSASALRKMTVSNLTANAGVAGISSSADATAITIDSSEQVGIGTTSPDALLELKHATNVRMLFDNTVDSQATIRSIQDSVGHNGMRLEADNIAIRTASGSNTGVERMRINNSGNIQIGTTTESGRMHIRSATTAGTDPLVVFSDASGTTCGSIDLNASGNTVSYVTSSDHRLKENVSYDFDATSRLKQLKPARFNFIADPDTTVDGFIAHEVSSIVPEAITKTKDAVKVWKDNEVLPDGVSVGDNKLDDNGNTIPDYQGIDQSKLVPLLVKTIQELEARITELENA